MLRLHLIVGDSKSPIGRQIPTACFSRSPFLNATKQRISPSRSTSSCVDIALGATKKVRYNLISSKKEKNVPFYCEFVNLKQIWKSKTLRFNCQSNRLIPSCYTYNSCYPCIRHPSETPGITQRDRNLKIVHI